MTEAVLTKKVLTLAVVHTDGRVLLGMKKRGFGEGKWNGFGGKVEEGESVEAAALRELEEEAGVRAVSHESRGKLDFIFEGDPTALEVHVFHVSAIEGEPRETDEMRPEWFRPEEIPYHGMWADDRHWLPHCLDGKSVEGHFWFKGEELVKYRLEAA